MAHRRIIRRKNEIFVGNIARGITDDQLIEILSEAGRVENLHQVKDRETGTPRGFAFVEFDDPASCESAIRNLDGRHVNGRKLVVNYPKKRSHAQAHPQQEPTATQSSPQCQPQIPKAVSKALDSISLREKYEIMRNMKQFAGKEPEKARLMLISYPNVTEALLEMQNNLGMTISDQEEPRITSGASMSKTSAKMNQEYSNPNGMNEKMYNSCNQSQVNSGGGTMGMMENYLKDNKFPYQMSSFMQSQFHPNSQTYHSQPNVSNLSSYQMIHPSNKVTMMYQEPPPPQQQNMQTSQQIGTGINETHGIPGVNRGMYNTNMNQPVGPAQLNFLNTEAINNNMAPPQQVIGTQQHMMHFQSPQMRQEQAQMQQHSQY